MMRYRKLSSPGGDYVFGQGNAEFLVDNPACVAQAVLTALLLHQGEWFLDTSVGMPWETQVLGYGTRSLYDTAIKAAILGVQGVQSIVSYSSSLNVRTRLLTVNAVINTIFGTVELSQTFNGLGYGIQGFGGGPYPGTSPVGSDGWGFFQWGDPPYSS